MDSIHTLLKQKEELRSVTAGPNSSRAAIICDLVDFMEKVEVDKIIMRAHAAGKVEAIKKIRAKRARLMKYWLGRTKHLEPADIYDMISKAKKGRNPQALFNHLLKS